MSYIARDPQTQHPFWNQEHFFRASWLQVFIVGCCSNYFHNCGALFKTIKCLTTRVKKKRDILVWMLIS